MLVLQRGSAQLSYSRILFIRFHSHSTRNTPSPTEFIVTNTSNILESPQNTEKQMHTEQHTNIFKNALNNIPTRILHQLLKKNRIKVSSAQNHNNRNYKYTPPKKLLLSKLFRLTNYNTHKASSQSRLEINNFVNFSSELVRKTCLKLRDLNEFYNTNYHLINTNHPFHQTVSLLIAEINTLNRNIYEISTSHSNPSIDINPNNTHNFDQLKRDFLYELLPSIHDIDDENNSKHDHDMIKLCQIFIKFINFPRFTMFDHIQYISHLCHIDEILNGFLIKRVHPSRTQYYNENNKDSDKYNDDEYDDEYDDDQEFEADIQIKDENGNNVPFQIQSARTLSKTAQKQSFPMDEDKVNQLYMNRLKNIYKMDLAQYGVFGMDENVQNQLKRALLSRGLHPSFITNKSHKNAKNDNVSASDFDGDGTNNVTIEHNKGILLHGPPGTGKTLLAKSLKYLLLTGEENVSIVNGPEIEDTYIGQTEKNIRNLFENAKNDSKQYGEHSPLHIIIFDEIDSIAKKRDSSSNSKVYDKAVQQLLSCLDGANTLNNVLTIGTTNRYQDIDNALLRPGRFGCHIFMSLPDEQQRYDLLTNCCGDIATMMDMESNGVGCDLKWLINLTEGLSHSDIVALLIQSKINGMERIIQEWFEKNEEDDDLYENIRQNFKISSRDIVCALDEIRINQVYRERNNRQLNDHYAYDIVF